MKNYQTHTTFAFSLTEWWGCQYRHLIRESWKSKWRV